MIIVCLNYVRHGVILLALFTCNVSTVFDINASVFSTVLERSLDGARDRAPSTVLSTVLERVLEGAARWPNKAKTYTYEEVKDWVPVSQIEPGDYDAINMIIIPCYVPSMSERYEAVKAWRNVQKQKGTLTQEQEETLDAIILEGEEYITQWNDLMTWTASEKSKDNHDWADSNNASTVFDINEFEETYMTLKTLRDDKQKDGTLSKELAERIDKILAEAQTYLPQQEDPIAAPSSTVEKNEAFKDIR